MGLHLSRYLRLFRRGEEVFLEAVLDERFVPVDPELLAVIRALGSGAEEVPALLAAAPMAEGALYSRLAQLRDLGLLLDFPDQDRPGLYGRLAGGIGAGREVPIVDQIELTNVCPMRCIMCPTGTGQMTRPKGFMELATFERITAEIAGTQPPWKTLILHNLGESLFHPSLASFVKLAAQRGLRPELSVNPGHLPLARYLELAEAGLARLVIALDGVEAETLEKIRGKAARGVEAAANLDEILAHRAAHPAERPELVIQMIRMPWNAAEQERFLARYGALHLPGVTAYLKEIDANTDPRGGPVFTEGRAVRPYLCRAPWLSVVVLWDGRVVPCCYDANAEVPLGNVNERSLREIWRGEEASALRARLASSKLSGGELCDRCPHHPGKWERPPLDVIPMEQLHW